MSAVLYANVYVKDIKSFLMIINSYIYSRSRQVNKPLI